MFRIHTSESFALSIGLRTGDSHPPELAPTFAALLCDAVSVQETYVHRWGAMAANGAPQTLEDVERQLKDRMIASGEWGRFARLTFDPSPMMLTDALLMYRLVKALQDRLSAAGWEQNLRSETERTRLADFWGPGWLGLTRLFGLQSMSRLLKAQTSETSSNT